MTAMLPPKDSMNDLIAVSRRYGADPAFVLAGGGNTSFKQGNRLFVKASGHALATIGADGFVELDRDALEAMLSATWPADAKERESLFIQRVMATRLHPELNQRPSVEALLHHLLPDALVVHTHPGLVNAITCCVRGEELARRLLGDDVLWQPYVDPGLILAQTLRKSLAAHADRTGRAPVAILLANHGLIVAGNSAAAIESTSQRIIGNIRNYLATLPALAWTDRRYPLDQNALDVYSKAIAQRLNGWHTVAEKSDALLRLVASDVARDVALSGPLTPDQIVYCRSIPMWISDPESDAEVARKQLGDALAAYAKTHGFDPWVCLIAGAGMIAFRESAKLAQVTASIYADAAEVYHNAARLGGVHAMSQRDRQFIEQWEVEAYRRSVMSKSASV